MHDGMVVPYVGMCVRMRACLRVHAYIVALFHTVDKPLCAEVQKFARGPLESHRHLNMHLSS